MKRSPDGTWPVWQPVTVFLLLALGIAAIGYQYYSSQSAQFRKSKEDEFQTIAGFKAQQVALWREERFSDAHFILRYVPVVDQVRQLARNYAAGNPTAEPPEWMKSMFGNGHYFRMMILGADGSVLSALPSDGRTSDSCAFHLLRQALADSDVAISDIYLNRFGLPRLDLAIPIFSPSSPSVLLAGVLLRVDPFTELYPILHSGPFPAKSAECLIVRHEYDAGEALVYLNPLYKLDSLTALKRLPISPETVPTRQQFHSGEGVALGRDYRGETVLASVKRVPNAPWLLVAKADASEIFHSITERGWLVSLLVIVLIGSSGVVLSWIWHRQRLLAAGQVRALDKSRHDLQIRYDELFQNAHDVIILADHQYRILDVNRQALESYQYDRASLLTMHLQDLTSPDAPDFSEVLAGISAFSPEPGVLYESTHRRRDGSLFPVEISLRPLDADGQALYLQVVRDISARQQAEDAQRASELRARAIIQAAPYGAHLYRLEEDGRLIFSGYNPAADRIVGVEHAHFLGKTGEEIFPGLVETGIFQIYRQVAKTGAQYQTDDFEYEQGVIRGTYDLTAFRTAPGQMAVFFRDVTLQKAAESELRRSRAQLQQLAAHIELVREEERKWVAREVHDELGQVLTALRMDLNWITKRLSEDPQLLEKTREMDRLTASAMQSVKRISSHLRPVPLQDLGFEAALEWLIQEFREHSTIVCRAQFEIDGCDPSEQDSTALFRILQEALNNVARHSQASQVQVRMHYDDRRIRLRIADDGIGIDPAQVNDLTSFGLIGMRERARSLGGDVRIYRGTERGTVIEAELPRQQKGIRHDSHSDRG